MAIYVKKFIEDDEINKNSYFKHTALILCKVSSVDKVTHPFHQSHISNLH